MRSLRFAVLGLLAALALLASATPARAQDAAAATELAQVSACSGDVTIKVGSTGEVRRVFKLGTRIRNGAVYTGDEIGTGANGKVSLLFGDGSVLSLDEPNTQIAISHGPLNEKLLVGKAAGKEFLRRIKVLAGKVHGEIQPGSAIYTEFETPSGVAGVKGTILDVAVGTAPPSATITLGDNSTITFTDPQAGTTVDLGDGQSAVFTWDPATGQLGVSVLNDNGQTVQLRIGGTVVTLEEGDAVTVQGGDDGAVVTPTAGDPDIDTGGGGGGTGDGNGGNDGFDDGLGGDSNAGGQNPDGSSDLNSNLQQGGGLPTNDAAPPAGDPTLGADYLLMSLEFGHMFHHEISKRLDPGGPFNQGDANTQFHSGVAVDSIKEGAQSPPAGGFGGGHDARVMFVEENRDLLNTKAGMDGFANENRAAELETFNDRVDSLFGSGTSGAPSGQIFPDPPVTPFTRTEGVANTGAYFDQLLAGNFGDPAAIKAAFNLALDRAHLNYHEMLEQGGVFNDFDHNEFHDGDGASGPYNPPPPFAGIDNLHTRFHGSSGSTGEIHSWFHTEFCNIPGADTDATVQALHGLFHKISGIPEDACAPSVP